jgi:hypothetical protein
VTEAVPDQDEYLAIVSGKCQEWVSAARNLRFYNQQDTSPGGVLKDLREVVRPHLDQLEVLLDSALMLRNGAVANARERENDYQDRWDAKADKARRGTREYEGAQERYAWYRLELKTPWLDQWRLAQRIVEVAQDAEERIRLAYYGLDKVRQDLNNQLRVEGVLERT